MKLPIKLNDLLHPSSVESERIEYTAHWNPDAILRTVCAFANDVANLGGGYVVIGQDTDADGAPTVPPAGLAENRLDPIQCELLAHCELIEPPYFPTLSVEQVEGRHLLVLWAPGGPSRPYKVPAAVSAEHKTWHHYIRRHTRTVEARGDAELELRNLATRVPFDDRLCRHAGIDDLSPALLLGFLRDVNSELAESAPTLPLDALARQLNVAGGASEAPAPKNAGLLFFNEAPDVFFPGTQIDVLWFPEGAGGDRFEEKSFKGPIGRMAREALDFIRRNYLIETVIKHPQRAEAERVWNFPFAAIEEAVVNAIYHRSYEEREPIEVRIDRRELVVLSFPGPDRSIRLSDLQAGRAVSRRYRNRRIGEFLKELNLTEGRATGIPKILKVMASNGSPPPVFETDDERTSFVVRLPVHVRAVAAPKNVIERVARQVVGPATGQATGQDTGQVAGQDTGQDFGRFGLDFTGQEAGQVAGQDAGQVTKEAVRLVAVLAGEMSRQELQQALELKHRDHFTAAYLTPALKLGLIEMTLPHVPRSGKQRYRLTAAGKRAQAPL